MNRIRNRINQGEVDHKPRENNIVEAEIKRKKKGHIQLKTKGESIRHDRYRYGNIYNFIVNIDSRNEIKWGSCLREALI